MNDSLNTILNILTMLCLIVFAGGINAELADMKIGLLRKIFRCFISISVKPLKEINAHWTYLLCYPLIVALLGQFIVIVRQFRLGKMYIKADVSFVTSFMTWILVPAIILGLMHLHKKNNKTE